MQHLLILLNQIFNGFQNLTEIAPVTPVTYVQRYTNFKVYEGSDPGTKNIVETVYNVMVYDKSGKIQTYTNNYQVSYTV